MGTHETITSQNREHQERLASRTGNDKADEHTKRRREDVYDDLCSPGAQGLIRLHSRYAHDKCFKQLLHTSTSTSTSTSADVSATQPPPAAWRSRSPCG